MSNNKYLGFVEASIKIYKNELNEYKFYVDNSENIELMNILNEELKLIDILKNKKLVDIYKEKLIDRDNIINDYIKQKKIDILDTKDYMIQKNKEICTYKEEQNNLLKLISDLQYKLKAQDNILSTIDKSNKQPEQPKQPKNTIEKAINLINADEINDYIKLIDKYYSKLQENIEDYDNKIDNYTKKIENLKILKEHIILEIIELEKIPSLHIGDDNNNN